MEHFRDRPDYTIDLAITSFGYEDIAVEIAKRTNFKVHFGIESFHLRKTLENCDNYFQCEMKNHKVDIFEASDEFSVEKVKW